MEIENRTLSEKLINSIEELKKAINKISVYDLSTYTAIELYYQIANKINEIIEECYRYEIAVSEEIIKQNECLQYLLNNGLVDEVVKKLNSMVADGTMAEIINVTIFNDLNNKIDTTKDELVEKIHDISYLISDYPRLTGETDDAPRLQRAIDDVYSKGGGTIKLTSGTTYDLKSQVKMKPYITIKGTDNLQLEDLSKSVVLNCYYGKNDENNAQIILSRACSLQGLTFNYPEQVGKNSKSPIPYGYTISTDLEADEITINDNVNLKNLMLLNSYNGINLKYAGRFNLENIYGQPLKTGLYIDQVWDVARIKTVHFWTFVSIPNEKLYTWIHTNGRAFDIRRVDQLSAFDMFCYGYNEGFYFDEYVNGEEKGGCWGTFVSCCADVCNKPIFINKVQQLNVVGGTFTTANITKPIITTGQNIATEITENGKLYTTGGKAKFTGVDFFGGSNVGVIISSVNGNIIFNGCDFNREANNKLRGMDLINEGDCEVILSGCHTNINRIAGGGNTIIDGVRLLDGNTNITGSDMTVNTKWIKYGTTSSITNITDGIQLKLTSSDNVYDFVIPTGDIRENFVVIEMDYQDMAPYDHSLYIKLCNDDGSKLFTKLIDATNTTQTTKVKLKFPVWIGKNNSPIVLRIEGMTYNSSNVLNVNITNAKMSTVDKNKLDNRQLDLIFNGRKLNIANDMISYPLMVCNGKIKILEGETETWK